jgi:hypothetical protein
MAEYTPVYTGGVRPFSRTASAAVIGGRLVETTTAGSVGPAAAGSVKVEGVAAFDAAIGARVSVWPINNVTHEIDSSGTIAVGDGVQSGAAGVITTGVIATLAAAGSLIGEAISAATGGAKGRFIGRA